MRTGKVFYGPARAVWAGLLALALSCAASRAEERPVTGLLWRERDVPAVFPLQVRTLAGRDYYLLLVDAVSGQERLGAYLRGGEFFRVLVPPGRYELRVSYGTDWQGEVKLFGGGAETGSLNLPDPLAFKVTGLGRKSGHQVDLRGGTPAAPELAGIHDQALCQSSVLDLESLRWPDPRPPEPREMGQDRALGAVDMTETRYSAPRYDLVTRLCP
ncbi:hypothetical protein DEA8626_03256 [Defluviimonas aquaemixtae]|uniref:DUF2846 domain-containing protein n=1 Tax=Albidovulum aquaemixtae TaxID=1542388 RepID=A0A2R8BLD4_9RHOB|nr:hypothetical protein [Defluviimonas aquaemixtae]SPH24206.1 hypothetical protein DEA8626_03256 [Defluviimonas aquaemixtae]